MTSSADSPHSKPLSFAAELAIVCGSLCIVVALATLFFFKGGYILWYGDAQAHLNISRSIIDSLTPGYDQLGTVWLPVLHVICLPFATSDWLWNTGLAGSIPVACCFVIAGACFYALARQAYESSIAALVTVACLALNPNVLYLAAIPMTEIVFLTGLAALLLSIFRFRLAQSRTCFVVAIVASWSMSLTRYDGWFLIPFAAVLLARFAPKSRWTWFILFGALASLAPFYWIGHNWWETGNALDFYNGPYSARAIQGGKPYPGFHDWLTAIHYYSKAGQLCTGWPLVILGAVGVVCAWTNKRILPILFLLLTPLFYLWAMHSSGNPVYVPQLWPHGYYNSRYGIAVVVLAAFAAGAIVMPLPKAWRKYAVLIPLCSVAAWLIHPSPENWICWKESQVNSVSRNQWTQRAAQYLEAHRRPGELILAPFGDLTGIFCRAKIPIRDELHEGNGPLWFAATSRPDLVHPATWAIAQTGTRVHQSIAASDIYRKVAAIQVPGAPELDIYKRTYAMLPMRDIEEKR